MQQRLRTLRDLPAIRRNRKLLREYSDLELKTPPIFVVGAPRSGSTLLYQALVHASRFSFFTNAMMEHPRAVLDYLQRNPNIPRDYVSGFTSDHGRTSAPHDPHEGWPFWRRFYPRQIHDYIVSADHVNSQDAQEIRTTIALLEDRFGVPFLAKNMEMALRLRSLQHIFPNAILVLVKRDPRAIASSILKAREKVMGDREIWWSMRPANYEEARQLPIHLQIAHQINGVYGSFYRDVRGDRWLDVYYEDFCQSPTEVVEKIIDFTKRFGIQPETRHSLPDEFEFKRGFAFTDEELADLMTFFQEHAGEHKLALRLDT